MAHQPVPQTAPLPPSQQVGPPASLAGPAQPTGPTGLQRFVKNLGKAGLSLATGVPAIELDRRIALNKNIEANTAATQQDAEAERVEAEKQARIQALTPIAFGDGPQADAALKEIFALDPASGQEAFENIGAIEQSQREEASRDANAILGLPEDKQEQALMERVVKVRARGGDPSDTLDLLKLDPQSRQNEMRIIANAPLTSQQRVSGRRAEEAATRDERRVAATERGLELREDELTAARSLAEATRITKSVEQDLKTEEGLRKEVNTLLKDFFLVADASARVKAAGVEPTAAGDLALIFNYMKMLDPGSTVREGEFANAQNSASVPQRVRGLYNSITQGQRLSAPQRDDFLDRSESLFDAATSEATKTANAFERIATNAGVNVGNVLAAFQERSQRTDQPATQTQSTASPQAVAFLRANDTSENRAQFVQKFGALPEGF